MSLIYKVMNDEYDTIKVTHLTNGICQQIFNKNNERVKRELVSWKLVGDKISYCSCTPTDIVIIPLRIGKVKITGILNGAFKNTKCDIVIFPTTGRVEIERDAVPKDMSLIVHGDVFERFVQSNWTCVGNIIKA